MIEYLEPSFTQIYKYSSPNEKALFRIAIELVVIDFIIIIKSITVNLLDVVWINIIIMMLILLLFVAFIETICILILMTAIKRMYARR